MTTKEMQMLHSHSFRPGNADGLGVAMARFITAGLALCNGATASAANSAPGGHARLT